MAVSFAAALGFASGAVAAESAPTSEGLAFFENRIRPQLVDHCYECHSASAKKLGGGLRLDTRADLMRGGDSGAALVAGQPEQSRLLRAIRQTDAESAMPPAKSGKKKLPDTVIADFVRWIQLGAPFPEAADGGLVGGKSAAGNHWSFQPIQDPPRPAVRDGAWPKTSIDHFILATLESKGHTPSPTADRRTLLRRVAYDLTGLPPTAEELESFVSDTSPDAYPKAVERLLNSPRYGERWGRHWLDVVRYADTAGETADYPVPVAWRYRNYVIDAFNADRPYNEFLREQIAGDILAREGPPERYAERVTATGYLAISRRFGFDSENYHHLTIQDTIDTIGQNVLGLTLGCARCHSHKYDPVTIADYYALYGIFDSTRYAFPGSEQKQRHRALVPLVPVDEALTRWHAFETRVATLAAKIQAANQSVPSAVLSSLTDMDGDFEMQAVAAGGSKGVLVPPWLYEGAVAVTSQAQSPFKNLHALGRVGASIAAGTNAYRIAQTLYVKPSADGVLHFNLDLRCVGAAGDGSGTHRIRLGSQRRTPTEAPLLRAGSVAVELAVDAGAVSIRVGDRWETIRSLPTNSWQNIQLELDLRQREFSGRIGAPGSVTDVGRHPFLRDWVGALDFVEVASGDAVSGGNGSQAYPGLELDNLGVQATPIPPVTTQVVLAATGTDALDGQSVAKQLTELAGMDGDFELQSDATPPKAPWGPGPNSVVQISAQSQSPFDHIYSKGQLGIRLPNSGAYNGFGRTLTNHWKSASTPKLYASFDFRCFTQEAGGNGSWRYFLGHGPGSSPAIELFITGTEFFRRSGDARDRVQSLRPGEWYTVRLTLDLKSKSYEGVLASRDAETPFQGSVASGWDGSVDYTFIDSYGHLGGVKPGLDADNLATTDLPLPKPGATAPALSVAAAQESRERIDVLRRRQNAIATEAEQAKQELNALLAEGPYPLAYAVAEGTPHNVRVQLRGEPEKPGDEVARGFIRSVGGSDLPADAPGSGRLQLAEWLASPSNPLTARVMANRIWLYHFGTGLVKTPNDFGTRGQKPTHPALLDHLATEFIRSGWSIKAMHRLILLSATYQQASGSTELEADYGAFPRRRLSAEEIRDSILYVSGALDATPGTGHAFPSPVSWGYTQHGPFNAVYEHDRRSIYLMTQRIRRHPFLALFDGADPNASSPERRITTVPTQALFFLNDPFVHAKATVFAKRFSEGCSDDTQRIRSGFRLALGRSPSKAELDEARAFVDAYRGALTELHTPKTEEALWAAYARVLFGNNEFLHLD